MSRQAAASQLPTAGHATGRDRKQANYGPAPALREVRASAEHTAGGGPTKCKGSETHANVRELPISGARNAIEAA